MRSLFQLNKVYRPELLLADHRGAGRLRNPAAAAAPPRPAPNRASLYIHAPRGRKGRAIDAATEEICRRDPHGVRAMSAAGPVSGGSAVAVDRIDPAHLLRALNRLDVEIDHDGFVVAAHQHAFERLVG